MAGREDRFPLVIREGNVAVRIYRQDRRKDGKGVAYHVADCSTGRRRLRTFADLSAARAEASRLARLLATGQAHAAALTNSDAAAFGRAISLLEPTGVPLETACALFAEAAGIVGNPVLVPEACRLYARQHAGVVATDVRAAVADYIETKRLQGASKRYLEDLASRLGRLADAFQMNVGDITTAPVQAWLDGLKLSPQSMRNFRAAIAGLYKYAKARGWTAGNPADGLAVPRIRGGAEPEVFTPDEFSALLAAATPDFLPVLVLGGFCGLRSAEIERIHWEDVLLPSREVVVRRGAAKTRSRRVVPLCDAACTWLASYTGRSGPVWRAGHEAFYTAQRRCAAAAGVTWRANGLRHSYGTYKMAITRDAVRVAHEMGNSPEVIHRHYRALASEAQARAWFGTMPGQPANVVSVEASAA